MNVGQVHAQVGWIHSYSTSGEFGHFEMDVRNSNLDVDVNSLIKGLISKEPNFFND